MPTSVVFRLAAVCQLTPQSVEYSRLTVTPSALAGLPRWAGLAKLAPICNHCLTTEASPASSSGETHCPLAG